MLFVSGMMGPYMSPIPANASAAMLFSFFVAVMLTPWLMLKFGKAACRRRTGTITRDGGRLGRLYVAVARPILAVEDASLDLPGWSWAWRRSPRSALFYTKHVTVKLLPFDNKSELQVVVDLPEGSSVEDTDRALQAIVDRLAAACPRSSRSRPMPARRRRSTSTAWCATTICAPRPSLGDVQVNLAAEGRARPRQPRHRARHARAARPGWTCRREPR